MACMYFRTVLGSYIIATQPDFVLCLVYFLKCDEGKVIKFYNIFDSGQTVNLKVQLNRPLKLTS